MVGGQRLTFREGLGSRIFDGIVVVALLVFVLSIFYPFLYMFSVSVSDYREVGLLRVKLFPIGMHWDSYKQVFKDNEILIAYKNSIVYTSVGTILTLILSSLGGYVLGRKRFKGRVFFTVIFTITMFFHGGMIPEYLNINMLGLMDTMWAVVLPPAFGFWYIVLVRTNFKQLPYSLVESAYMDGANDWLVLFRIVMPLSKAILAAIAVFASVQYWNNYFLPLLYLTSADKQPLPIILRKILILRDLTRESSNAMGDLIATEDETGDMVSRQGYLMSLRMATIFVSIGPIVLVYPFLQKYFVRGVLVGSIRG